RVDGDVTGLDRVAARAFEEAAVEGEAAADPDRGAAQVDHGRGAAAGAPAALGQRREVRVVGDQDRGPGGALVAVEALAEELAQRQPRPVEMERGERLAVVVADRGGDGGGDRAG